MGDDGYRATLMDLYARRRFGMRPGLEVIEELLGAVGHPERSFSAIHVTGSKGKGSVSALAASILTATGERVGLFTSPHLVSYRERIRIGSRTIPRSAVVRGIGRLERAAARGLATGTLAREPTFFELTTALAFDWFCAEGVRHAVIEVGLGGRLDSTNVLRAPVGVLTTIELEHTDVLGPTLTDVAREKAGILHPGMRGVVGEVTDEPLREIGRSAAALGVPLERLGREIRVAGRTLGPRGQRVTLVTPAGEVADAELPLFGTFQASNAALAVAASQAYARAVGLPLSEEAIRKGLRSVRWRGRLERVARRPDLFFDVAHTPESARAVAVSLAEMLPFADPADNAVVFGCLADKRAGEMLEALAPLARTLVVVPVRSARGAAVEALRRAGTGRFPWVVQAEDAETGLAVARAATGADGFTLALGSDYLIGDLLRRREGVGSDEPDLSDPGVSAAAEGGGAR